MNIEFIPIVQIGVFGDEPGGLYFSDLRMEKDFRCLSWIFGNTFFMCMSEYAGIILYLRPKCSGPLGESLVLWQLLIKNVWIRS